MRYHVRWNASAEGELASIWMASNDRRAITAAVAEIDSALAAVPETAGESRSGGARIVIAPPLAVTYEVIRDDWTVRVMTVRLLAKRRGRS